MPARNVAALETSACIIADAAVASRSVGTPYVYEAWSRAVASRTPLDHEDAELVSTYINHAFGLPLEPRDERHRRGWLAEFIFWSLAERIGTTRDRTLVHVEGPDWHATKPGRDSLVLWERSDGVIEFRLWESKQSVGSAPVSASVSDATVQLRDSALSYLAQATSIAAAAGAQYGEKVREIYGELARLWAAGSPQSGIGISVATAESKVPVRCFSTVSKSFPRLTSPSQIEGLVAGIADYVVFADDVRDRVWDASLSFELIAGALGADDAFGPGFDNEFLPTPEHLQDLLAQAEVRLFIGQEGIDDILLRAAWFLHGVASADQALELYQAAQQRQAFAVSAHVFDLACNDDAAHEQLRLQWAFAAQVGFHRSEAEPNASAIGRRAATWTTADTDGAFEARLTNLALHAGIAFLALDAGSGARRLSRWNREITSFERDLGTDDTGATVFGPTILVVHACHDLLRYLREGDVGRFRRAQQALDRAVSVEHEGHDHIARWVASHLRSIGDAVATGSVSSVLPPSVPDAAKQAFTMTAPHILTLWQPQRELLAPAGESGNGHGARRLIVSVPTSAGKTLISQLLMIEHLALHGTGVCYVAPQRSLGREVRRGLMRRLRLLARELARLAPDAGLPTSGGLADLLTLMNLSPQELMSLLPGQDQVQPDIVIMTPERLAHALREDADAVLSRYGLFVFDEAHQIRERGRGFLLESVISFLHWRSRNTDHRLVLLSAVLGNAGQIRSWIDPDEEGRLLESSWRGPRRLSVLFGVRRDREAAPRVESVNARGGMALYTQRRIYPVHGTFRLKPTGRDVVWFKTTAALGQVSYRATSDGVRLTDPEGSPHSTQKYRMLAQMISFLGRAGSVLVVCDDRRSARNMALAIAETLPIDSRARGLALTARIKLGEEHALPGTLDHGVAYHHAGLPSDLLESIEDAVRQGDVSYLVSTSTLTEGVNLPVRTVVLNPSYYPDQPEDQKMSGPRLINAIGRAGRAVLETEGWVVMTHYGLSDAADFDELEPPPESSRPESVLTREDALADLETFEVNFAAGLDAAMAAEGCVADFQVFVWFALAASDSAFEDGDGVGQSELGNLDELLSSTLAFQQLPEHTASCSTVWLS